METKISRRQFLGGAAAVAGAIALPSLVNATPVLATPSLTFPLAIDTGGWVPLDAKTLARYAYEIYKGKHAGHSACCEATYWPIVSVFAARFPDTWGLIPKGMFNYGGGGVNAYGSICGCPNGASALLAQISGTQSAGNGANTKTNFMRWYETTALPTNAAYLDFASGTWTPGGSATDGWGPTFTATATQLATPYDNIPKSAAGEVLCHVSLTKWRAAADQWTGIIGKDAQSDRCGKLCYDAVFYLANLINSWKAGNTIDGSVSAAASATGCKNPSCHGSSPIAECDAVTAQGSMNCTPCHGL